MKISKRARQNAKQLLRSCMTGGALDERRCLELIRQVLDKKPRGYLQIATQMHRLLELHLQNRTARIESATPLAAGALDLFKASLTRRFGPGLSFEYRENPQLIGGVRVQVGSDVFDGSIRARLNQLAEKL
jgi:F-type H+-transporting ATPase subunit delta